MPLNDPHKSDLEVTHGASYADYFPSVPTLTPADADHGGGEVAREDLDGDTDDMGDECMQEFKTPNERAPTALLLAVAVAFGVKTVFDVVRGKKQFRDFFRKTPRTGEFYQE